MGDPSKSVESLFPMEACPQIPDEAFNLFHSIDRELYARLIQNLGRDPSESVQVMGFWMWLEREGTNLMLIKRLLSLPPAWLNGLADETVSCLKCVIKNDALRIREREEKQFEITMLPEILGNPTVGLRFFRENRVAVLEGIAKIVNTVCTRAFCDIPQRATWRENAPAMTEVYTPTNAVTGEGVGGAGAVAPFLFHPYMNAPFLPLPGGGLVQMPSPPSGAVSPAAPEATGIPMRATAAAAGSFPGFDLGAQRQVLSNEFSRPNDEELTFNNTKIVTAEVPVDDRTIFLTFSKGYPINQDEVREFFTRKFGDFIEDLIMQEVGEDEQVLYARMVARAVAMGVIEEIVGGNKAKYSINGKHVWARKYVKKQHQQQLRDGDYSSAASTCA